MYFKNLVLFIIIITVSDIYAQEPKYPDYIILNSGEKIKGKVGYAPGDKVNFKNEAKKNTEYKPLQIKGYLYKNVFYTNKYIKTNDYYVFMPTYRPGDDSLAFKKETGYTVKIIGEINLYHKKGISRSVTPYGNMPRSYEDIGLESKSNPEQIDLNLNTGLLDNKKTPVLTLANLIKSNLDLYSRVMEMRKLDFVSVFATVKEYNEWYLTQQAATK